MSDSALANGGLPESENLPFLKSVYDAYGGFVYTLCLRLLADRKAAESTTVEVFVRFIHEQADESSEPQTEARLRELAIRASLARLRRRGGKMIRRALRDLSVRLRQHVRGQPDFLSWVWKRRLQGRSRTRPAHGQIIAPRQN